MWQPITDVCMKSSPDYQSGEVLVKASLFQVLELPRAGVIIALN